MILFRSCVATTDASNFNTTRLTVCDDGVKKRLAAPQVGVQRGVGGAHVQIGGAEAVLRHVGADPVASLPPLPVMATRLA